MQYISKTLACKRSPVRFGSRAVIEGMSSTSESGDDMVPGTEGGEWAPANARAPKRAHNHDRQEPKRLQ
eukprot:9027512-Pyramimonas_sp.AAC.1